jgi:hypothetical protein
MPANSIDIFDFISLSSSHGGDGIETVYEHGELQQRAGVDGTALIQTGLKGDPFQVVSLRDVATFADAQALRVLYKSIVNAKLVVVACGNTNYYTTTGHKYIVRDVTAVAKRLASCAGGLTGGTGQGLVTAHWTLVPVYLGVPGP